MSQQINLYNPLLKKQREWLSLRIVLLIVGAILLVEGGAFVWQRSERSALQQQLATAQAQMKQLQEEITTVGKMLAERQGNQTLTKEIELATDSLRQREDVLGVLSTVGSEGTTGFSGIFMAFARQTMDGVWLTGFSITQEKIEIRGRMVDGALLPAYIRRLEAESAFRGRRFSALDMKGVEPAPAAAETTAGRKPALPSLPYVEFMLQGSAGLKVAGQ